MFNLRGRHIALLVAAVFGAVIAGSVAGAAVNPNQFVDEKVMDIPAQSIAGEWMPDGRLLTVTRAGQVYIVDPSAGTSTLMVAIANVGTTGNRGAPDLELHPNFANNQQFYVYHLTNSQPAALKIVRFTLDESSPTNTASSIQQIWENPGVDHSQNFHIGGSLDVSNDGKLLLTIGDGDISTQAASLNNVFGKVIRLELDGSPASDNPFFNDGNAGTLDDIWAYGLRNPFRAHVDPTTGIHWVADVGGNVAAQAYEEVNQITKGANYGWPSCEGPLTKQGGQGGPNCPAGITGPWHYYDHFSVGRSITGGEVYRGTLMPVEMRGSYFFSDYIKDVMTWIEVNPDGSAGTINEINLISTSRPVWVSAGPDGWIYYMRYHPGASTYELRRVRYTGVVEQPAPGLVILDDPCVIYASTSATAQGLSGTMSGDEVRSVKATGPLSGQGGASSCVPFGASSVVFRVTSVDPLTEGNLRMTPAGVVPTGGAGVVNYGAQNGLDNANTVTVPVSAGGAVDIEANAGPAGTAPTTDVRLVAIGYYSPDVDPDLKFFPVNPCAAADSRVNKGASDQFDGPADDGSWPVGSAFPDIDVVGTFSIGQGGGNGAEGCGVPTDADAVLVNVVAVNAVGGSGHLSVGTGGADPISEATTPFAVLSPKMNNGATTMVNLGPGGTLAVDVDGGLGSSTMIRVEVLGYYKDDGAGIDFEALEPCAVFDSRSTRGAAGSFVGERLHGVAHATTYQVAGDLLPVGQGGVFDSGGGVGTCGVPVGAEAVLINLEAVNAVREANFWVSAAGTSTTGGVLNFNDVVPKMNNANAVVVPLSALGQLDLEINAGSFTADGTAVTHARGIVLGYYN